jgi:hypothetical protein
VGADEKDLLPPAVETVAEDLALEDLVRQLDIEAALQEFLDGGGEDPHALVVVAFEILPLEEDYAQAEVAFAGKLEQLYGG